MLNNQCSLGYHFTVDYIHNDKLKFENKFENVYVFIRTLS